ncbi:Protein of unknown function [Pedococcus cremeus]|uniref:DUF3072 domain-containing protein n=1 Tax=Pedococcus cremeus TaxID=587636 RepID=A0A1H9TL80_9MICO|nr:DUF3072 domain-containing protein [Pedococcus cremeus]SER97393.1 Protein of unknown function [Pedococcus cremeus]
MTQQTPQQDNGRAAEGDTSVEEQQETLGASEPQADASLEKDPSEWVSGDDPMTPAQRSYLDTLARQAGEELPADLSKAEASEHIDRLRRSTGQPG